MKRNQLVIYVATISAFALVLAACSGGGQQTIAGSQCPAEYTPGFQAVPAQNQKPVQTKPDGTMDLAQGTYNYNHAEFYYVDNTYAPNRNYRILVQDVLQADGSWKAVASCIRNARLKMGDLGLAVSAKGLSGLTIGTDNKPTALAARVYGFKLKADGGLEVDNGLVPDAEKPTLPADTFNDPNAYIYVHTENPNLIEVRSTGTTANGTWHLSTTFLRVDLPKTP